MRACECVRACVLTKGLLLLSLLCLAFQDQMEKILPRKIALRFSLVFSAAGGGGDGGRGENRLFSPRQKITGFVSVQ